MGRSLCLVVLLLLNAMPAWAGRNAFVDPSTPTCMVLRAHGFVESNAPGEVKLPVADDIALVPGRTCWDGAAWQAYTPPPPPEPASCPLVRAILTDPAVPGTVKAYFLAQRPILGCGS